MSFRRHRSTLLPSLDVVMAPESGAGDSVVPAPADRTPTATPFSSPFSPLTAGRIAPGARVDHDEHRAPHGAPAAPAPQRPPVPQHVSAPIAPTSPVAQASSTTGSPLDDNPYAADVDFNATRVSSFNPWSELVREVDEARGEPSRPVDQPAAPAPVDHAPAPVDHASAPFDDFAAPVERELHPRHLFAPLSDEAWTAPTAEPARGAPVAPAPAFDLNDLYVDHEPAGAPGAPVEPPRPAFPPRPVQPPRAVQPQRAAQPPRPDVRSRVPGPPRPAASPRLIVEPSDVVESGPTAFTNRAAFAPAAPASSPAAPVAPTPADTASPAPSVSPTVPGGPTGPGPGSPSPRRGRRLAIAGGAAGTVIVLGIVGIVALGGGGDSKALKTLVKQATVDEAKADPIGSTQVASTYENLAGPLQPDSSNKRPVTLIARSAPTAVSTGKGTATVTTHLVFEQAENLPARYLVAGKPHMKRVAITWTEPAIEGKDGTWNAAGEKSVHVDRYIVARHPKATAADTTAAEHAAAALTKAALSKTTGQSASSYNAAQPDAYLTAKLPAWKTNTILHKWGTDTSSQFPPAQSNLGYGTRTDVITDLLLGKQSDCIVDPAIRSVQVAVGAWHTLPTDVDQYVTDPDLQHVQVRAPMTLTATIGCENFLGHRVTTHHTFKSSVTALMARPKDTDLSDTWRAEKVLLGNDEELYAPSFTYGDYAQVITH